MKRLIPRRLGPRLFVLLAVVLVAVEALFAWHNVVGEERRLTESMEDSADQLSRSLVSATWQAMLADRREDAYAVMRTMGSRQGIERLSVADDRGEVTFTTGPGAMHPCSCTDASHALEVPHQSEQLLPPHERARYFEGDDGRRRLGMLTPIHNEPSCQSAACHAHPPSREVLGSLDVVLDVGHVDDELARLALQQGVESLARLAVLWVCIFAFTSHVVVRPIRRLIEGTQAIAEGDLDRPIRVRSTTEIGDLAVSFQSMQEHLRSTRAELQAVTQGLEDKVERRSRELESARRKLIQSDRLASLGQLAASVAHEINNPIGGVLNLSMILQRILTDEGIPPGREAQFRRHLGQISDESRRVGRIVTDLLAFSRRARPQRSDADMRAVVDRTLALIKHRLDLAGVSITVTADPGLPLVPFDPAQLEQVVLNLVMNACEALSAGGEIRLEVGFDRTRRYARITVSDDGPGIPKHIIPRIYDPFFTTKGEGEGKGVGLGLSVVFGIVVSHGGTLDVETEEGRGTTFIVRFPLQPENGEEVERGRDT